MHSAHRIVLTALILIPSLTFLLGCRNQDTDDRITYSQYGDIIKQLDIKRDENLLETKIRELRTFPHLDRAYRLESAGKLMQARKEYESYLAIDPLDLKVKFQYLMLLNKIGDYKEAESQATDIIDKRPSFYPAYFYRGIAYKESGDVEHSIEDLKVAISIKDINNSDKILAYRNMVDLYISNEDYQNALSNLDSLEQISDKDYPFLRAVIYREMKDYMEAEREYLEIINNSYDEKEKEFAYRGLAEIEEKKHNYDKAESAYLSVLDLDPKNSEVKLSIAELMYKTGRIEGSLKWAKEALEGKLSEEQVYTANMLVGGIYLKLGEYKKSREYYEQALNETGNIEAIRFIADSFQRQNNLSESAKYYNLYLDKNKNDSRVQYELGVIYTRMGQYDKALDHLYSALTSATENLKNKIHEQIGFIYTKKVTTAGEVEEIEREIKLRKMPSSLSADIYENLAYSYMSKGNYDRAIEYFKTAINKGNSSWGIYENLAYAYKNNGDSEKALNAFKKSLQFNSLPKKEKGNIYQQMGLVEFERARYQEASTYYLNSLNYGDDDWKIRQNLGFTYFKLGLWEKSLDQFQISYKFKEDPQTLIYMGRCYKELNKPGLAIHYMEKGLELKDENSTGYN